MLDSDSISVSSCGGWVLSVLGKRALASALFAFQGQLALPSLEITFDSYAISIASCIWLQSIHSLLLA